MVETILYLFKSKPPSLIQPSVHKCDTSTVSRLVFANADLSRQNKKRLIALYILAIVSYIILNA